jgi:geranylgeranyl pyrophosphate synthase
MAGQNKMTAGDISSGGGVIEAELSRVREFFSAQVDCSDAKLKSFMDYLKNRSGKMLRARALLLSGRLFGEIKPLHIKLACIVEMIHSATLLHDDVIDNGSSRRFQATANNLWGANMAVLLGDYLLSRAFDIVSALGDNDIMQFFAQMAQTICRGEMLQNVFRGDFTITLEQYIDVITKKTAVFFADCCMLGAIASDADEGACKQLYEFGNNFGIGFQIADDLVDICGVENQTGKSVGRDFSSKTITMPVIFALRQLDEARKSQLLFQLDNSRPNMKQVLSILMSGKGIEFTNSQIREYQQKALSQIERFTGSPIVEELKNLVLSSKTNKGV